MPLRACGQGPRNAERGGVWATIDTLPRCLLAAVAISTAWLLLPAAVSLALFAWLLTLHDTAAGRIYAAYGGVYIGVARVVDQIRPTAWDLAGVAVALAGMGIFMFQPAR